MAVSIRCPFLLVDYRHTADLLTLDSYCACQFVLLSIRFLAVVGGVVHVNHMGTAPPPQSTSGVYRLCVVLSYLKGHSVDSGVAEGLRSVLWVPMVFKIRLTVFSWHASPCLLRSAPREVTPAAGFELLKATHRGHNHIRVNRADSVG